MAIREEMDLNKACRGRWRETMQRWGIKKTGKGPRNRNDIKKAAERK